LLIQGLDHVGPTSGRTAPYEEIQIISPPSVYEMFSRNSPRETTNFDRSSGYVIPANGRTSPYSVVQIISPPSVHEMLNRNRPGGRKTRNSDRSSGYEEVHISSGYTELDRNRADETNDHTYQKLLKRDADHAGEIKTTPGYTEPYHRAGQHETSTG
jgi:hypothetical protein